MTTSSDPPPTERVVLVVGSCGLDRLLTVPSYPNPDDKVRTSAYNEVGGGNAANTAAAMGRLKSSTFLQHKFKNLKIRLLTKLGDDAVGQQLLDELQESGVDTASPFLLRPSGTTTAFTTIIVSEDQHTRTCLHTPGTCGELEAEELDDMDQIFENVVHLHSDSRHSMASLCLAREAKRRGIPISCDAEKDRKSKALDELMLLSDILFTNSSYLRAYLGRLHSEKEQETNRPSLEGRPLSTKIANTISLGADTGEVITKSMTPSVYYKRWYPEQSEKQVVVTQGHMGSLLFTPVDSKSSNEPMSKATSIHEAAIHKGESNHSLCIQHQFNDTVEGKSMLVKSQFNVNTAGVRKGVSIVDSTGAGDAFIGGHIMASLFDTGNPRFCLDFGTWVAGQKLEGPGARVALPWGDKVDSILGKDIGTIQETLRQLLGSFNTEPGLV